MSALPRAAAALATLAFAAGLALPASGLTQPNGAAIPSSMGCNGGSPTGLLPVFACACTQPGVCNVGAPCPSATSCDDGQHGTCESTLWHSFNDNTCIPSNHSGLDPWKDGAIVPETFHPSCGLTYTVLSRGTARFQNAFGWYNAGAQAPAATDLHVMLDCSAAAGASVTLDLSKEPAWTGGDVGFFLVTPEDHAAAGTCAGGDCCASTTRLASGAGYVYYSQRELNPDGQGATPYIHLLVFDSKLEADRYYFGWEDTFHTTSADFTDLVTSVSGVQCAGAGAACSTGKQGICALGVTECAQGQVSCAPVFQPKPDTCNGVDDDCNGQVDDGATCPDPGDVCDNGKCVQRCGSDEFQCPAAGTKCDPSTGLCVDPTCIGVTCPASEICAAGQCGTPCTGTACPYGQTCVGNACLALCSGVKCPAGEVCAEGACIPGCSTCGGIACAAPLACSGASGACLDPSCPSGCPSGKFCQAGACVDACDGAKCPMGQSCQGGQCVGPGAASADGGLSPVGSSADGGAGGADASSGNGNSPFNPPRGGCACDAAGSGSADAGWALAAGALGAWAFARARRKRARAITAR